MTARLVCRWMALAALVAVAGACGVPADDEARNIDRSQVPINLLSPTTAPPPTIDPNVPTAEAFIYLVDESERTVIPVQRKVPRPANIGAVLHQLFDTALTPDEEAKGLSNVITRQTRLLEVRKTEEVIYVNLDALFPGLTSEEVSLAEAQVVFTVNSEFSTAKVQFQVKGRTKDIRLSDGRTADRVDRNDFAGFDPSKKGGATAAATTTTKPNGAAAPPPVPGR